jgi:hypothetical protein
MNLKKHLDGRFRGTTWLTLVVAMLCLLGEPLLPEAFGNKNSPVETVQMVVVLIGLYMSCTAKDYRSLFVFVSLVLFFVFAREVNYGRTLFIFEDPENANQFPKWKDMEYGWVAHLCVGLYMVWLVVYFCWRKVWKELWETCRGVKLPAADVLLALVGLAAALVFESAHDSLHEELGELLMYTAGMGVLYLYTRKKLISVD